MNQFNGQTPSTQDLRTLYEEIELGVYQSTNVKELDLAYQTFLKLKAADQQSITDFAGPARVVSLALRGYELPDAQTRNRSSEFVLELSQLFDTGSNAKSAEQFWLMLAQQQGVLLQRIEDDLDALQESNFDQFETQKRVKTLGKFHKLLRSKADAVVKELFETTDSLAPIPSMI